MPSLTTRMTGRCACVGVLPLGPLLICWSVQRGLAMRKLLESLRLLLARIRRLVTGQR